MAEHGSRELWRTRCEQLIASSMKVHEWCALNHVRTASIYEWLKRFHREDPSMFGGIGLPEGMDGFSWRTPTARSSSTSSHSPSCPAAGSPSCALQSCHPLVRPSRPPSRRRPARRSPSTEHSCSTGSTA